MKIGIIGAGNIGSALGERLPVTNHAKARRNDPSPPARASTPILGQGKQTHPREMFQRDFTLRFGLATGGRNLPRRRPL
jgi:pyrroline-5-carboxylate reductase